MEKYLLGIDLGGTFTKVGLVSVDGRLVKKISFPTTEYDAPREWIKKVVGVIKGLGANVLSVGVGIPGAANFNTGVVYYLPNLLKWRNVRLADALCKSIGATVIVENDATAMAWAEYILGAAKGVDNAICITLGTGVGGGIILNGKIYRGPDGAAGEIGHFPLRPWGKACSCNGMGCLERYVGNASLIQKAKRMGLDVKEGLKSVTEKARAGDRNAIAFWELVAKEIAPTIIGVVNLLNLERVVIGGGVGQAGRFLSAPLSRYVKKYAMPLQAKRVRLVQAKLKNDAGLVGAALLSQTQKGI